MNVVVVGAPLGAAGTVARGLLAADPHAPVTLLSDDGPALLAALDQPGLGEVLLADPTVPGSCDEALVHRQLLHGVPDGVVVAVEASAGGSGEWPLGEQVTRRLPSVPLVVTGPGAAAASGAVADLAASLEEATGRAPLTAVVPGADPDAALRRLEVLIGAGVRESAHRTAARPATSCCS